MGLLVQILTVIATVAMIGGNETGLMHIVGQGRDLVSTTLGPYQLGIAMAVGMLISVRWVGLPSFVWYGRDIGSLSVHVALYIGVAASVSAAVYVVLSAV